MSVSLRAVLLGLVACMAGACAAGGQAPAGGDADPLAALPACEAPPGASTHGPVDWLELPAGTVITEVAPQPPLMRVSAYAGMTPVQMQDTFEARDDLDIMFIENEVYEFEVLASDGVHRTYLRAQAICSEGSSVVALTVAELDAQGVQALPDRPIPGPGVANQRGG